MGSKTKAARALSAAREDFFRGRSRRSPMEVGAYWMTYIKEYNRVESLWLNPDVDQSFERGHMDGNLRKDPAFTILYPNHNDDILEIAYIEGYKVGSDTKKRNYATRTGTDLRLIDGCKI